MRAAIERDMPMLCVCRGHQLLSVERGGHLYQHLPETPGFEEHGSTGGEWSDHIVKIDSDSKLGAILISEMPIWAQQGDPCTPKSCVCLLYLNMCTYMCT